jgi:hypothetical protein
VENLNPLCRLESESQARMTMVRIPVWKQTAHQRWLSCHSATHE